MKPNGSSAVWRYAHEIHEPQLSPIEATRGRGIQSQSCRFGSPALAEFERMEVAEDARFRSLDYDEAKQMGWVAAIMGVRARPGSSLDG